MSLWISLFFYSVSCIPTGGSSPKGTLIKIVDKAQFGLEVRGVQERGSERGNFRDFSQQGIY
jgi:hypothetical protein